MVGPNGGPGVFEGEVGVRGVGGRCGSELMGGGWRDVFVFNVSKGDGAPNGKVGSQLSKHLCAMVGQEGGAVIWSF